MPKKEESEVEKLKELVPSPKEEKEIEKLVDESNKIPAMNLGNAYIGDILKCRVCGWTEEYNQKNVSKIHDHCAAHTDKTPLAVFEVEKESPARKKSKED